MTKKLLILLAGMSLLIAAAVLSLPSLLSTSWGNQAIVHLINRQIPGNCEIDSLSFSWFGDQKIEGLRIKDTYNEPVITVDTVTTSTSIYPLLVSQTFSGNTRIKNLYSQIKKNPTGQTNLQDALGMAPLSLSDAVIKDSSITGVDIDFAYTKKGGISLKAYGATLLDKLSGAFSIDLILNDSENALNVDITDFPVALLDGFLAAKNPKLAGTLTELLGQSVNVKIQEKAIENTSTWQILSTSENLFFSGEGTIENQVFHLQGPASVRATVTTPLLKKLLHTIAETGDWKLASNADIHIDLNNCHIPLSFFNTGITLSQKEDLKIQAKLSLPNTELITTHHPQSKTRVKDFSLTLSTPPQANSLLLSAEGEYFFGHHPTHFRIDTKLRKPTSLSSLLYSFYQPTEIEFFAEKVPATVGDSILGTDNIVSSALGETFNFRMKSSASDPRALRLSLMSSKLDIPELVLSLNQDITDVTNLLAKDWSGTVTIDRLLFKRPNYQTDMQDISIPWSLKRGLSDLKLNFFAKASKNGKLTGNLEFSHKTSLNVTGKNLPTPLLELISGRTEIEPLFGDRMDTEIAVELKDRKGSLIAKLHGQNGHLFIKGKVANNRLYLSEPLTLSTKGSNSLGPDVIAPHAPVFKELLRSENPITLTISAKNASFPLSPFRLEDVQFESASLNMGKLIFKNAGEIKDMMSVLRPPRSEEISLWTTPLYMSMQGGKLQIYRMDFLVMERYPMATWGKVDFSQDQVHMIIGATGAALAQALDLPNIKKDTMLQIPVKGRISHPKIDTAKASRKIGALLAHQSGGPQGLVIGTVLDLTSGKDAKIPEPITSPFPWGEIPERERLPASEQERSDPVSEIKKEASKLLHGLFR